MPILIAAVWIGLIVLIHALRSRMHPLSYGLLVFAAVVGTMPLLWFTMSWLDG